VTETLTAAQTAAALAELSFSRASDYQSFFSDFHRMRIGNGSINIVFSKTTHSPGVQFTGSVVEEKAEVVMTWTQMKMMFINFSQTIEAIEKELGAIPVPQNFQPDLVLARDIVRGLLLSPRASGGGNE
jgi:hypothetical protein